MRFFGQLLIHPQVILASGIQSFVSQNLFHVDDGAAVKDQVSGQRSVEEYAGSVSS